MKKRIITGIIMAVILVPLVLVPELRSLLQVVIMLFSVVATLEMINMCEKERKFPLAIKVLVVIGTFLLYLGIVNADPVSDDKSVVTRLLNQINFKIGVITTLTLVCAAIFASQVFIKDFNATDVGRCFMIILYTSLGFSAVTTLLFNGMRFVVYLFIICIATDIFALVFGLSFGKHKMCPTISPKKTWEGAIGGAVCGTLIGSLFAILYGHIHNLFYHEQIKFFKDVFDYQMIPPVAMLFILIGLSLLISISGQIGDLICSKFKRTYEIKDFSQIFPGHGGVLDRFDSVLFASVIFLCFITIVRIVFPLSLGV